LNQLAKIETGNLIQEYGLEGLPRLLHFARKDSRGYAGIASGWSGCSSLPVLAMAEKSLYSRIMEMIYGN